MKPLIGITSACDYEHGDARINLGDYYVQAVRTAGGTALVLPPADQDHLIEEYIGVCHGLLLSGGGDLDPFYWGEPPSRNLGEISPLRDSFELDLASKALEQNVPILGICRGCQVINVAAGGSLIQHISSPYLHMQKAPRNYPIHAIFIKPGSRLFRVVGSENLRVNSFHHQAVKKTGPGLEVSARAADNTIEAVESASHLFVMGVQWHPECMGDEAAGRLFAGLVEASRQVVARKTGR